MTLHTNRRRLIWFLLGLGSQLQLVASLSITELVLFMMTPVLFFQELPYMRRNGIMTLFNMAILMVVGCVVSSFANHSGFGQVLRGLAVTCLMPCSIVVMHSMLRRDMKGYGWLLVGASISFFACTFVFQHSFEVESLASGERGSAAVGGIMSGPIYWITRLGTLVTAWPRGWYLSCPTAYCVCAPLGMALFSVLTSASGRSVALANLAGVCLVLIGRKKQRTMRKLAKNFWLICLAGVFGILCMNVVYRTAATSGWMGEKAQEKYEAQTRRGTDILSLLIGGRADSFAGLYACLHRPLVGFGPWAVDNYGYYEEFLRHYGAAEDFEAFVQEEQIRKMYGGGPRLVPGHSHIFGNWVNYGLPGFLFWCYVLFIIVRFVRYDCWVIPHFFFWLVASIPGFLWAIFFSPLSDRVMPAFLCVAMLMARAVRRGRMQLSPEMQREIWLNERK